LHIKEEWWLCALEEKPPEVPELPSKIPGVWAEDNPHSHQVWPEMCPPVVVEQKLGATPSAKISTSFPTRPRSEFKNTFTDF
jgi:hypothetical protein